MNRKLIIGTLAVVATAFAGGWLFAGRGEAVASNGIQVVMYQNPSCQCCGKWARHMTDNGYEVEINKTAEINQVKIDAGLTPETASCHTAYVDGYVVEGHVPARDVERLLAERPDIVGIAVPGMPMGSPGMEGNRVDSYDVVALHRDGTTSVWASY